VCLCSGGAKQTPPAQFVTSSGVMLFGVPKERSCAPGEASRDGELLANLSFTAVYSSASCDSAAQRQRSFLRTIFVIAVLLHACVYCILFAHSWKAAAGEMRRARRAAVHVRTHHLRVCVLCADCCTGDPALPSHAPANSAGVSYFSRGDALFAAWEAAAPASGDGAADPDRASVLRRSETPRVEQLHARLLASDGADDGAAPRLPDGAPFFIPVERAGVPRDTLVVDLAIALAVNALGLVAAWRHGAHPLTLFVIATMLRVLFSLLHSPTFVYTLRCVADAVLLLAASQLLASKVCCACRVVPLCSQCRGCVCCVCRSGCRVVVTRGCAVVLCAIRRRHG
jgi:hypothetical protein